ncbi:MAG: methylenetetrahydrofolate--tRNA-(uracil(54)-C(5))-methyltransferase (FADH(2)-oxidizing) TrmFO [Clostridia bacterium]|nr:methylenetetrahydrofolate--tRNA-(uracil(54)-C(5))-methyltransferase (FADH(2)-oxidizing) TrmFO [Clostridia bacterium]
MKINIIGGGLAGSEAALYLANRGYKVDLYDIKGKSFTPAHHNPNYAEIVCSNSFKSEDPTSASGILKQELLSLGSTLLKVAYDVKVPSGGALAVDREQFASKITELIKSNSNITLHTEDVGEFEADAITIVATGPLSTDNMCKALSNVIGSDFLYFFDAAAPIIDADSINTDIAFMQGRYDKGGADYLNCPMTKEQYLKFYNELINAEGVTLKDFENKKVFESCMPIEVMARRGEDAIRFGPLKPVGLMDKRTNIKPYAVVQLRKENVEANMFNMVGFQTNLIFPEQKRVFRLIPGLENAEFLRYGVMHRNNFINFPKVCDVFSRLKANNNIFIAGQLSGVEGYVESIASGLYCAINVANMLSNKPLIKLSNHTIIGGLYEYLINANTEHFQPINANLGILAPIEMRDKQKRNVLYAERSKEEIKKYIN